MSSQYSPRAAIRHITRGFGVTLTDEEVSQLIAESLDDIEAKGMAVREAAKAYESFVMELAADMVARRENPATPDLFTRPEMIGTPSSN